MCVRVESQRRCAGGGWEGFAPAGEDQILGLVMCCFGVFRCCWSVFMGLLAWMLEWWGEEIMGRTFESAGYEVL